MRQQGGVVGRRQDALVVVELRSQFVNPLQPFMRLYVGTRGVLLLGYVECGAYVGQVDAAPMRGIKQAADVVSENVARVRPERIGAWQLVEERTDEGPE